jgi:uncharacterized protein YqfB (UPF0267 family)
MSKTVRGYILLSRGKFVGWFKHEEVVMEVAKTIVYQYIDRHHQGVAPKRTTVKIRDHIELQAYKVNDIGVLTFPLDEWFEEFNNIREVKDPVDIKFENAQRLAQYPMAIKALKILLDDIDNDPDGLIASKHFAKNIIDNAIIDE